MFTHLPLSVEEHDLPAGGDGEHSFAGADPGQLEATDGAAEVDLARLLSAAGVPRAERLVVGAADERRVVVGGEQHLADARSVALERLHRLRGLLKVKKSERNEMRERDMKSQDLCQGELENGDSRMYLCKSQSHHKIRSHALESS